MQSLLSGERNRRQQAAQNFKDIGRTCPSESRTPQYLLTSGTKVQFFPRYRAQLANPSESAPCFLIADEAKGRRLSYESFLNEERPGIVQKSRSEPEEVAAAVALFSVRPRVVHQCQQPSRGRRLGTGAAELTCTEASARTMDLHE